MRPLALYVHWPFCVSKCPYCDFNSHVRELVDQDAWRKALLADLAHEAHEIRGELTSIFFGGGTPSLMPPATVAAVIEAARESWPSRKDLEITLEANPSSVEAARFADLALAGVNRVSLGVQSFDNDALALLGRAHGADEARQAVALAQQHFARVSFDLIYALPGQTTDHWARQLDEALAIGTTHLSLYQLTIEPGTRFATLVRDGRLQPLDADAAADLFDWTQARTAAAGIPAYETSNHAAAGAQSRHNLTYWRYGDYAGIGPGAHGRRNGSATERHRKPENYLKAVTRNGHGIAGETVLTPEERAREALVMGLRLVEGVDLAWIAQQSGVDQLIDTRAFEQLRAQGLVWREGDRLGVAEPGRLLLDAILPRIVAI